MNKLKKWIGYAYREPVSFTCILSMVSAFAFFLIFALFSMVLEGDFHLQALFSVLPAAILVGIFMISPIILTLYNIVYLLTPDHTQEIRRAGHRIESVTILFGALCSILWGKTTEIQWGADWTEQLYNSELHTPIATWTLPTIIAIISVFIASYLLLRCRNINRLPPLLAALAIGGLYLGTSLCIVWSIQLSKHQPLLCLYPLNLIFIAVKLMKNVIFDWRSQPHTLPEKKNGLIKLNRLLIKAENWPWLGLLCALPLLGILIAVLVLFGQAPDSIIQAWTETSDWTFSQQVAPQNIYFDQHYLCTVAAGGHRKIVKPIRAGKRHGHRVLVNRQLCVANAFEQLLEERVPRFHRIIRCIYDRFGYPIAKHIHSPYAADAIWFLMKPLEWSFLAVLYLFDTKPENRIAVQYPHAPFPEEYTGKKL